MTIQGNARARLATLSAEARARAFTSVIEVCSTSHMCDVATSYAGYDPPYIATEVRPDSVTMAREPSPHHMRAPTTIVVRSIGCRT